MFESISDSISKWLLHFGIGHEIAASASGMSDFIIVLAISCAFYYVVKYIIIRIIRRIAKRTKNRWDDILLEHKVFNRMAFFIPGILVYQSIPVTLSEFSPAVVSLALKFTNIYIVVIFLVVINSFFNALYSLYQDTEYARFHPVKGFIQVGKMVVYTIGALLILSYFFNQSPLVMLTGLGAFSAVLLLIFKDAILGFVGGIQLSANDMVRQGDWINMSKFGADGTVQEISLTTVKVQNWDNTITTLPTYSMVSESFQNFRGMKEAGARRMKRSINIDMASVKFCTPEMLEKFRKIEILKNYIDTKQAELQQFNTENNIDDSVLVNGRRQTNIGVFRAYLEAYLLRHPQVHKDFDLLVRQLQPTPTGIPVEVYAFTTETRWASYENVQSDIFDHILAIVPEFELFVFQSPSGNDLRTGIPACS
ncbi:MAG TPA: mechanosensitive ion channel [Bacteroidales bacterium]|nr:mechanosensitive ion channel [Bacteroidales bacterium]